MAERKRVLIIGLDGFTWDIGKDLMAEGVMPNLARLVREGCHGLLRSVIPSETAPAWSSFQTGCRPGKTGIFTFHVYDPVQDRLRFNSFSDIAVPSLWELASQAGRKVVSLNLPITSPPPQVDGVIIPGLLCPGLSAQTVHPAEVYEKYLAGEKDYKIVDARPMDTVAELVERQIVVERTRWRVGRRLMTDVDWDIFCYEMQSTDHVQHHLWTGLDAGVPNFRKENRVKVSQFYRCCDEIIGNLVEAAGPDVLTLLVSDHGFTRVNYFFKLNVWLREHGYLKLTKKCQWQETKSQWKKKVPLLRFLARRYGQMKKMLESSHADPSEQLLQDLRNTIDIANTSAFSVGAMAGLVYLNAEKQLRKEIAGKISRELLSEYGPETKIPIIEKVHAGKELYQGEDKAGMPDLVVQFVEGVFGHVLPMGEEVVTKPEYLTTEKGFMQLLGTHSQRGVFLAHGRDVKAGFELDGEIVDIVPTVLGYMGIPIPSHVDGKALEAAFKRSLELSYEDKAKVETKKARYTDEEEAEIQQKLSDLGYL